MHNATINCCLTALAQEPKEKALCVRKERAMTLHLGVSVFQIKDERNEDCHAQGDD